MKCKSKTNGRDWREVGGLPCEIVMIEVRELKLTPRKARNLSVQTVACGAWLISAC